MIRVWFVSKSELERSRCSEPEKGGRIFTHSQEESPQDALHIYLLSLDMCDWSLICVKCCRWNWAFISKTFIANDETRKRRTVKTWKCFTIVSNVIMFAVQFCAIFSGITVDGHKSLRLLMIFLGFFNMEVKVLSKRWICREFREHRITYHNPEVKCRLFFFVL